MTDIVTHIFNTLVVFVLVWWVVIFTVLPWGNKRNEEVDTGHATGAPVNPRLKLKFIITTVISLILTAIIMAIIIFSGISLKDIGNWGP